MQHSAIPRDAKPPRIVVLPPTAFASEYSGRPVTDVAVGLRFVSQAEFDTARKEAEREAAGFYKQFDDLEKRPDGEALTDIYNDAFLGRIAMRSTCDPNDVAKPYFPFADDVIRHALTPEAMRLLWDELVIMHKGSVKARQAATDEDIRRLATALRRSQLDDEGRRLCAYLLEKLGNPEEIDEDAENDGVYHAIAAA
jgi:hypothetical protein